MSMDAPEGTLCPLCRAVVVRIVTMRDQFQHYRCSRGNTVFYWNRDHLELCTSPSFHTFVQKEPTCGKTSAEIAARASKK